MGTAGNGPAVVLATGSRDVGIAARPNNGVTPLPIKPEDFLRAEEILTLAILAAMTKAHVGDYCPFGEIVITFEHGKPTLVEFERKHKPAKIKPEPTVTQE